MDRNSLIAAFAAPSIALVSVGLATGAGFDNRAAYGAAVETLSQPQASAHAAAMFARADLDRSGALDADEYAALAIVTAELARLNGFIALEIGDGQEVVSLPIEAPMALAGAERARVGAVARAEFYASAGDDGLMDLDEYTGEQAARFKAADRNRNGALAKTELVSFAARSAMLSRSDV